MGAGLLSLQLWGRLRTTTGKDYYVAVVRIDPWKELT